MAIKLPLIRLSAINPFLIELRRRGMQPEVLLGEFGLPGDVPASHELFVASTTVYDFVERSAEFCGDRHLGYEIGLGLDLTDWDPMTRAAKEANTLGEMLTLFSVYATEHSTATQFFVRTDGQRSTFGLERSKVPPFKPGQNDAFYVGIMSRLLEQAAGARWEAKEVLFQVADPDCVPSGQQPVRIAAGGNSGVRISFPTPWLMERLDVRRIHTAAKSIGSQLMPSSLVDSVRSALRPHIHESDLTADRAAKFCGRNRRKLSQGLREEGTTLRREIAQLRAIKAQHDLENSTRTIAQVGESIGFADPTVFSRAFKKWTGQSPMKFRKSHRH
jgi:AraC-like DNA-binding protein